MERASMLLLGMLSLKLGLRGALQLRTFYLLNILLWIKMSSNISILMMPFWSIFYISSSECLVFRGILSLLTALSSLGVYVLLLLS